MFGLPPPVEPRLDNGYRSQDAHARDGPGNDLDGLYLVAQGHATLYLALEF